MERDMQAATTIDVISKFDERRSSDRHVAVMLIAKVTSQGQQSICRIRDISTTGVKIETNIDLHACESVALELRSDLKMIGRVRWKRGQSAGIQFDAAIDLERYLLRTESKIDRIKARAPRYRCSAGAMAFTDHGCFTCLVSDISLSGVGLTNIPEKMKLRAGQTLRVISDGLSARHALIVWVDCDRVGLKFRQPIKYTELQEWLADHSCAAPVTQGLLSADHIRMSAFTVRH
jgi:hypothetical protein